MGHKDSIYENYVQKGVWVVEDKHLLDLLTDSAYSPIINLLRERPLTIKELTKKYNEIVKEKAVKLNIPLDAFEKKMKRSEKSIYRYVNDLIDANLVVVAGRRIIADRTASENLYGRTAKIFLMKNLSDDYWDKEEAQPFLDKIARLLAVVLDKPVPSTKCLAEVLNKLDTNRLRDVYKGLEEKYDVVAEILLDATIKEGNRILDTVGMLMRIWNCDEYLDQLKKCIKD